MGVAGFEPRWSHRNPPTALPSNDNLSFISLYFIAYNEEMTFSFSENTLSFYGANN
jgi:hypothetical protein